MTGRGEALVEAQIVQAHLGTSLSETFEEIYDLDVDDRLRTEMLIVRLPVEEDWDPDDLVAPKTDGARRHLGASVADRKQIFARVRDRSVHLLGSHKGQLFLTCNLSPHWPSDPFSIYGLEEKKALDAIRTTELEYILECSRAILSLPRGSQYLTPSRRLVQSFIRVGNIQYDRDAIDAICYWLLPHLQHVGAILTDTWSISSIAFNVSRTCSIYFGVPAPRVEMMPSYNDGSDVARQKSRRIVERLDRDATSFGPAGQVLLCLISATQTGSFAEHLREIFTTSDVSLKPRFVTLFRLGPSPLPTLHDLSSDDRFTLLPKAEGDAVIHPSGRRETEESDMTNA